MKEGKQMLVKDKITGLLYDPKKEFDKLLSDPKTIKILKRLKFM